MKALVTGTTGFIGSHLVERLVNRGYSVRCMIRSSTKLEYVKGLPVEFAKADFDDPESLDRAVDGVEYIFHIGGVTKSKDKEGYYRGNTLSTKNLLDSAARSNRNVRRFLFASSLTAVGPGNGSNPVDEATPCHPITTYGRSKMEAEKECISRFGELPITIIRPPAVYGPRDRDVFAFFNSVSKHIVPLSGFGKKILSFVHAFDLVDGMISAVENPRGAGQIYFISNDETYTWETLGKLAMKYLKTWAVPVRIPHAILYSIAAINQTIAAIGGRPALINIEKARDGAQSNWTCSSMKARNELGFRCSLSLEEGVEGSIRWYRENGWLK